MGKDKTKDGETATSSETNKDHSWDQEARDAALAKTIAEAVAREIQTITEVVAREMAKAHVQYQATVNENHAPTLPTTLKITSGSNGFRIMDPFDWTRDKSIYQRWQLWSHKARLTLDAMEGDSENTKISYFHHWINGEGISQIEGWKNNKILISQSDYDTLENKTGKYSSNKIERYFTLFELSLTPRSNPLLAVEDLYLTKQGSMTSGEFHSHILKIVKRCQFPCQKAEERAIRDAIFMGMNSQQARDKAINLMNSNSAVNFAAYDRRQNRGKSNRSKCTSGKNEAQNKTRVQTSSSTSQPSRKPPGMEGKCMRCGKSEHQLGQKCVAKNAKC